MEGAEEADRGGRLGARVPGGEDEAADRLEDGPAERDAAALPGAQAAFAGGRVERGEAGEARVAEEAGERVVEDAQREAGAGAGGGRQRGDAGGDVVGEAGGGLFGLEEGQQREAEGVEK